MDPVSTKSAIVSQQKKSSQLPIIQSSQLCPGVQVLNKFTSKRPGPLISYLLDHPRIARCIFSINKLSTHCSRPVLFLLAVSLIVTGGFITAGSFGAASPVGLPTSGIGLMLLTGIAYGSISEKSNSLESYSTLSSSDSVKSDSTLSSLEELYEKSVSQSSVDSLYSSDENLINDIDSPGYENEPDIECSQLLMGDDPMYEPDVDAQSSTKT